MIKSKLEALVAKQNTENATLEMQYKASELKVQRLEDDAKKAKHAYKQAEWNWRGEVEDMTHRLETLMSAARRDIERLERSEAAHAKTRADLLQAMRAILGAMDGN